MNNPIIFSGDNSNLLWNEINRVEHCTETEQLASDTHNALYSIGIKCQELESLVRSQAETIDKLKNRITDLESRNITY